MEILREVLYLSKYLLITILKNHLKKSLMTFKDIKQNFPIFLLDKSSVEFIKGKVTATTFPHPDMTPQNGNSGFPAAQSSSIYPGSNQRMVVDLTIEANGRTATYTVSEGSSINYAGNLIIATEQSLLVPEVEAIKNNADQALAPERIKQLEAQRDKSKKLLAEINPAFKQQQEYDQRLSTIEASQKELRDMMASFIKKFES